jgi:beta-lactamase regulating signal transducer with metallopeptidase domain
VSILSILLESTLKGSVLITLAGLALAVWRNASAATRHLVWLLSLVGALAMPLLTIVIPDWQIAPERTLNWVSNQATSYSPDSQIAGVRSEYNAASRSSEGSPQLAQSNGSNRPSVSSLLQIIWMSGTAAILLFLIVGFARTRQTVKHSTDTDDVDFTCYDARTLHETRIKRRVTLTLSESSAAPFVWGWHRPVIVLPGSARQWSAQRLDMVLSHELAHVRRQDNITGIFGWLTMAVYWFNPLVWLAARQLRAEQEKACDDFVLWQGVSAPEYAEQLLDISRSVSAQNRLGLESAFMHKSQLGERLMAILKSDRRRAPLSIGRTALLSLLMAAAILPLAALADRQTVQLDDVTPAERETIAATLSGFYDALNAGEDYKSTRDTYLSTGYFDPPGLTMENLEAGIWTAAFENTLDMFTKKGVTGTLVAQDRIKSIRHVGDRFIATLELNLTGEAYQVESTDLVPDGIHLKTVDDPVTGKPLKTEAYLAKALEHEVIFTNENGEWRISRYDGPIGIKRMDVDNPHGPIFLVWLEDVGKEMTPYGQMISKVIPGELRPFNNMGIEFKLEN